MKRRLFLVCMLFMLFVFAGCSQQNDDTQADFSDLPTITVGCDSYPPFSYIDLDGNMTGIDVELGKEAFRRLGYSPKFTLINWEEKKKLLEKGTIDCVWSSFTMNDREDEYNWAGPYMKSRQIVAVNEDSDIYSLQDLEGKIIAVQSTTKPEDIIRKHDGTVPELKKVISVQKRDLLFILLGKGYVDALAAHDTSVDEFMAETGLKFRILDEPLQEVGLGVAFDKNDERGIHIALNETLKDMLRDGTVKDIISKYLSDADRYMIEVDDEQ